MKSLVKQLKSNYDNIDMNIFSSVQNVNLSTIISYQKGDISYHFLDDYDKRKKKIIEELNKKKDEK